jgi:microcystin-dependent protein
VKILNVMDIEFNYIAAIGGYESYSLERAWNGSAYLSLMINKNIPNAEHLANDRIVWFNKEYHKAFIIEHVSEKLQGSVRTIEIIASSLCALLRDYITVPITGTDEHIVSGSREAVVRAWITANCISPGDGTRLQYPIILGTNHSYGEQIIGRTRYANLANEISGVLSLENLGWRVEIDPGASTFKVNVLKGIDRTAGQSTNPRVLFGTKYGNLAGFEKTMDCLSSRTVAYVGGIGDGKDRLISKVSTDGSLRKKEVFIDARTINSTVELTEKGKRSLAEYAEVSSFSFETLNRQFEYEVDWDLGDYVTIVEEDGSSEDRQIIKVTEECERGNIRIIPEFGSASQSVNQKFSSIEKRISLLELSESPSETGAIIAWPSNTIPSWGLLCNGQAVSRLDYSTLFSVIGTSFGAGDGSNTFNVPNIKGRIIAGRDAAQTEFDVLGEAGGAKTHTLTTAEIPSHAHTQQVRSTGTAGTAGTQGASTANNTSVGTTDATGSGDAHNNLQPYIVLNYIIKI